MSLFNNDVFKRAIAEFNGEDLVGLTDSELVSRSENKKKKKTMREDMVARIVKGAKNTTTSALTSLPSLQDNTSELIKNIGVLSGSSNN